MTEPSYRQPENQAASFCRAELTEPGHVGIEPSVATYCQSCGWRSHTGPCRMSEAMETYRPRREDRIELTLTQLDAALAVGFRMYEMLVTHGVIQAGAGLTFDGFRTESGKRITIVRDRTSYHVAPKGTES